MQEILYGRCSIGHHRMGYMPKLDRYSRYITMMTMVMSITSSFLVNTNSISIIMMIVVIVIGTPVVIVICVIVVLYCSWSWSLVIGR